MAHPVFATFPGNKNCAIWPVARSLSVGCDSNHLVSLRLVPRHTVRKAAATFSYLTLTACPHRASFDTTNECVRDTWTRATKGPPLCRSRTALTPVFALAHRIP